MLDAFLSSVAYILTPAALGWSLLGVFLGVAFGAVPGLGGGMLMALMLPATFLMYNLDAQIFLISIYVGGVTGGMISGILLGVPGAPSAIMTTIDGYAMARKGKAARALSLGIMASFFGGAISWLVLILLAVPLATIASKFQNFDYFAFVFFGLVLIAFTSGGSPVRALIAGFFGIFISTIGFDPISASSRFTFDTHFLSSGFGLLPVLLGVFAIRSVLSDLAVKQTTDTPMAHAGLRDILREAVGIVSHWVNLLRSSLIGSWIGLLPGIGANIGAVLSYSVANTLSKKKDEFGHGSEEAIVASEAGNNATVGGALIPMIALGIPGSGQDVLLMAALILHSVEPGPLLAIEHPDIFYGIISSYFVANIFMLLVMLASVPLLARVIRTPPAILAPIVLMFCVTGVIAYHNRLDDIWVMLLFGVVGYGMWLLRYPLAPFVIGFVLGPLAEERLRSALMSTGGEWLPLLNRPIAMTTFAACILVLCIPLMMKVWRKRMVSTQVRTEAGQ